jgi:HlyD family secretion protein
MDRGTVAQVKRFAAFAAIGLGVVLLLWLFLPSSRRGARQTNNTIETLPAHFREIEQIVHATGEVTAAQATDIKCEISGRVAKLNVKPGDRVKAGQVLMVLDDAELKSEEQEASLRIEASRLRESKARMDYDRKAELSKQKFVMGKELEDAKTELDLATNALQIDGARLQTLREKLVKSTITAPHDGTVLNLKVREGVVVTGANTSGESTLLMQVANLSELQVQSEINEVDVIKVAPGMETSVTFESVPGLTLGGTVNYVSPSALPKEKDKSIRVFAMTIILHSTTEQMKPGITANVTILTAKNPRALAVSLGAVFTENNEPSVFVRNGNGFERRKVDLGINDDAFVEIKQGLKEGDQVAMQHPPA